VVGGGIVGVSTAYFLGEAGVRAVVVERDSVGSHASGFAYGGLSSLGGPGPTEALASEGMRIHRELSQSLPEQTGTNTEFRYRPSLALALSEEEAQAARDGLPWKKAQKGYKVRWVEPDEVQTIEARVTPDTFGGVYTEGVADLEPYRLMLALTQAAELKGATVVRDRASGLMRDGDRVTGVTLENGEIAAEHVVLAMGPWAEAASPWLGSPVPIRPLKGQILRLRAPGPPLRCSIGWSGDYAVTKPDGLVWTGTTEEEVGFDDRTTNEARDQITRSFSQVLPSLGDAELVRQTACLRPITPDRLPLLGRVPGLEGVFIATGGGRSGILLGPAMGRITADLITEGRSAIPIDAFDLGRF
jgi:glycine oxidase